MASASSSIELPHLQSLHIRLDRSNYAFWRLQVLATIRAHGFTDFIDPTKIPPSQFLPTSSTGGCMPNPDYQLWLCRDQFLMSWLLSSISEAMLGYVTRCKTACELWMVLESLFQSQSKARIMQLRFQLQTTRKGDLSVDDFFLKMRGFADLLAGAGHPIGDDELILYILAGFGPEYEAIVVNLTHRAEPLNLQEVHFALQAQEQRLQSQAVFQFPSANLAYNRTSGNPSRMIPARGRGRFYAYIADFNSVEFYQDEDFIDDGQAQWVVDSGATNHITNEFQNLSVHSNVHGADRLMVGNGQHIPVVAAGQVQPQGADERSTGKGVIQA
ncbi:hypothetical protein C2S51_012553 [Perilla frutescens var. frutescens]|nr:hypothetical protein C2S51_012553 [Perilla frutescens var. frutescens]